MKQSYLLTKFPKNNSSRIIQVFLGSFIALLLPFLAAAQVPMTNVGTPTYTQTFDGLTNSVTANWVNNGTLKGWYVQQDIKVPGVITPNNGSNASTELFSLGDGSSPNRSLGSISSVATGKHVYVLRLQNKTGKTVNTVNVTFDLVQYWNNPGSNDRFGVSFLTGNTNAVNNLINNKELHSNSGWAVASTIRPPSIGRPGYKPGDRKTVSLDLTGFTLAADQEILIRFEDAMSTKKFGYNAIGVDNVSITANPGPGSNTGKIYHYVGVNYVKNGNGNGNGNIKAQNLNDLTVPANWNTKKDGTGTPATNFTDNFQTFIIDVEASGNPGNRPETQAPTLSKNQDWKISGADSKLILGDGSQNFSLTIPQDASFTGTIDLRSYSTFNIDDENNFDLNLVKTPLIDIDLVEDNSTVNYRGSAAQYISEADYYNLNVVGSDYKYLFGSSSAKANLNLNSTNIFLNEFDLTVGNGTSTSGTISRDQGYVVTTGTGSLQRFVPNGSTALFPVGTASSNNNPATYNPATIVQNGTSDLLSVRAIDGYYDNYYANYQPDVISRVLERVVNRSWVVEEGVSGGSNIGLNLQWSNNAQEQTFLFNPNTSVVNYYTGSEWVDIGNSTRQITNTVRQVTGNNIINLGVFGVGDGTRDNEVLPVELISFKARRVKAEVELVWQTAMEKNNDFFTLEQSADGKTFTEVAKVKGAGNSNQQKHYSYLHRNAPTLVTYYRLKQTDFDGAFTYSKVVALTGTASKEALAAYPNPSTGQYTIMGMANVTEALVIDATGRTVMQATTNLNNEIGLTVNLTNQKSGVYFLRLTSPTETQTLRLIKK